MSRGIDRLTPKERELMEVMCENICTLQEAAEVLNMRSNTAKTHAAHVRGKLGVKDIGLAAMLYDRQRSNRHA